MALKLAVTVSAMNRTISRGKFFGEKLAGACTKKSSPDIRVNFFIECIIIIGTQILHSLEHVHFGRGHERTSSRLLSDPSQRLYAVYPKNIHSD